jgi:hypothetical protein
MATFSYTIGTNTVLGNQRCIDGSITGGTSDYVAGTGYTFTPANFGLVSFAGVTITNRAGGFMAQWHITGNVLTLQIFDPTAAAPGPATEVASATNLTSAVFHYQIFGT